MIAARPLSSRDCVCLDYKQYLGRAKTVDLGSGCALERERGGQSVRGTRRPVILSRPLCPKGNRVVVWKGSLGPCLRHFIALIIQMCNCEMWKVR